MNRFPYFILPSFSLSACLVLAAQFPSLDAKAANWPFFRGPNHDGVSQETDWQSNWSNEGPTVAWRKNVGIGCSSMVVVSNRVITLGNRADKDIVTCLNANDGSIIWSYAYPCTFEERMFEGGTASTPTIDSEHVYTLSYDSQLHCLRMSDGELVWKRHLVEDFGGSPPRWKYASSPLIVDNMVILDVGGSKNSTLALDKNSGEKVWGIGREECGYATPIPFEQDETPAVALFKSKAMIGYERKAGRKIWRIPWETAYDVNASTPTILGDRLFISSGYKKGRAALYRLDGSPPRKVWENEDMKTKMSSCVIVGEHLYGVTEKKARLLCIDAKSGKINWSKRGFGQYGTLTATLNRLIVLTDSGDLVIVRADPDSYQELARAEIHKGRCWVNPVLANGRIFCKTNQGDLACVDVRN